MPCAIQIMKIELYGKTYELKKIAKPDEVIDLLIDALCYPNGEDDPIQVLSQVKDQYLHGLVPMYVNLRTALNNAGVMQKELSDILYMTPQDVNRRFSGVTKWKPLEKRAIMQFLEDRGIEYTEEQLFTE
nr:MAG TPA: LAC REPRESSOR HEADPIECE/DNA Complex, HALF-OPERATOR, LAC OPERATOR, LAC [Caudoviricetes sp.]